MFEGAGEASACRPSPWQHFQYTCVLTESGLPPTSATPFDPRRESREFSSEVEGDGDGAFLGLLRLMMVLVPQ
jgi:hypothetical protein